MAYCGRYNGGAFTNSNRRNDVHHYRSVHSWPLDFAGLVAPAYITSVFIGYIGTDSIGSFIKRFAAKKPEKMVEINNQRGSVPRYAGVVGRTDNGRQKTRNHGYDVIVGGEPFTDYSGSPSQTCHAKPKLKSTGAGRYRLLSRWWDAHRKQLGLKDFSPKSHQDAVALQQIKERRFTYDWSWWYPPCVDRCSNIPLHCRALVMVVDIKADSLIAKFKEAGGTVRDWCMSRVTAIISALVICIIVCLSWAVNHYRDNAITYKAQRKCQRTEAGERGNYWHADASAWCCCARCKIHEGVSWC